MEEICRLCCSSSFVQHEIFEPQGELHDLMGPFLFTPLQVRRNDGLPQRVCKACRDYVLQLHLFCSQAQSVQSRLRALLEGLEPLVKCEPASEQATQTDHEQGPYNEKILRSDCATQTEHQEPSPALPCRCSASLQKVDAVPLENIKSNGPCPSPLFVEIQHPSESPEPIEIDQFDVPEEDLCKEQIPNSEVRRVPLQVLQTESNDQDCKSNGCIDQDASLQKVDAVALGDIKTNEPCPSPLFVEIRHPPESPEPIQVDQCDVLEEDLCKEQNPDSEVRRVPLQVLQTESNDQDCKSNGCIDQDASLQIWDAVPLEDIKSNEPCPSPLFVEIRHPPESPEPIQVDQCDVLEEDLCKEQNPDSEVRRVPLQVLQTESNDQDCKSNGCIDQDASLQKVDAVPLEYIKTNKPCPSPLFVEIQHPPESPEPIQIDQCDVLEEDLCKEHNPGSEVRRVPLQVLQTESNDQDCKSNGCIDQDASLQIWDAVPLEDIKSNEPCPSPLFVEIRHPPESPEPIQVDQCDVLEEDLCKEQNPDSEVRRVPLQVLETESNDQDCKSNGCIDQDASLQKVDAVPLEYIKSNKPCPSPLFVEIQHPPESPEPIQIDQCDVLEEDLCKEQNPGSEVRRVPLQVLETVSNDQDCKSNGCVDQKSVSEDLIDLNDEVNTELVIISDSDDTTPLIHFKRKRKNNSVKKPSTSKTKGSANRKEKFDKKKSKKETKKEFNQNVEMESDGLEDVDKVTLRKTKANTKKSKTEDPYTHWCCICNRKMPDHNACLQHYEEHRSSGPQEPSLAEQEMPLLNNDGRCPVCALLVTGKGWPSHWQRHQKRPYHCRLCIVSCSNFDKLLKHGQKYHVKNSYQDKSQMKYGCDLCYRTFTTIPKYRKHRDFMHDSETPARPRCGRCAFTARSILTLEAHWRCNHEHRQHLCPQCGKSFNYKAHLNKHMYLHTGERPYKCQYCSRGFSTPNTMHIHERTHTGEKPYVCPECSRAFAQRSALVTHMRGLHGYARKHVCQLCAKAFTARSLLTAHQRRPCLRPDDDDDDDDDVTAPAPAPPRKPRTRRAKRQDDDEDFLPS